MGVSQKEKALDICDLSTYWKRLEVKVRELRTERAGWLAHSICFAGPLAQSSNKD